MRRVIEKTKYKVYLLIEIIYLFLVFKMNDVFLSIAIIYGKAGQIGNFLFACVMDSILTSLALLEIYVISRMMITMRRKAGF